LVIAGLAFWIVGRTINEFAGAARGLAEIEGIGLAALCAGLGRVAKSASDGLHEQRTLDFDT